MEASPRCIELIKQFEGCRLQAYSDLHGIPTVGYGHTSPSCRLGDSITQEQADAYLAMDVQHIAYAVSDMLTTQPTQNQFDALVSLAFNIGPGNLKASTLLRKFKQGDIAGAAEQFLRWNRVGTEAVEGLTNRREAERALFLEG